jgi:hypothetical protein
MKRTNIYLEEAQSAALDQVAHAQGISRAELCLPYRGRFAALLKNCCSESNRGRDATLLAGGVRSV